MATETLKRLSRREALELLGAAGAVVAAGCSGDTLMRGQNSTTNTRHNAFTDSLSQEMITLSGNTTSGFAGTVTVGV